jgi:hypothetical protein
MVKRKAAATPAFDPHIVRDPYAVVRGEYLGRWLVLGRTFCGYRAIGRQVHVDGVTPGVVHRVIADAHKKHYAEDENTSCASFFAGIKVEMLTHGATELAVQWVIEQEPTLFDEKELKSMAEKLQKKGTEPKKPAKAAPAKGGGRGGNPEALAKAREARAAEGAKDRKYKALVKLGDLKLRDGSWTARMVEIILGNKTTDAAKSALLADKEYGDRRLDFKWAEGKGFIEFA